MPSQQTLTLYLVGLVVVVWLMIRQLRDRRVTPRSLWIMPLLMVGLLAEALYQEGLASPWTPIALLAGAVVGLGLGFVRGMLTRAQVDLETGDLLLKGSPWSVLFWVALIAVKLGLRFIISGAGLTVASAVTTALLGVTVASIIGVRLWLFLKYLNAGSPTARLR